MEKRDLVFLEQIQNAVVILFDYSVFACQHFGHIDAHALHINAMFGKVVVGLVKVFRRLQQSFAGNAAHVGASTTRCRATLVIFPLINTGHAKAQLGCTNSSNVATGATANNDHVELFAHNFSVLGFKKNPPAKVTIGQTTRVG